MLKQASELLKLYTIQIDERLPKAKSGDRDATLNLLAVAAGLLKAGLPLPIKLSEWLALGFEGLSAGMTAEESFGFKGRGRGQRTAPTVVRTANDRFRRAYLVEYWRQEKGATVAEACAAVADLDSVDAETVNVAWDIEQGRALLALQVSSGAVSKVREIK